MLAAFVDEPERITAAQMDRWARAFDNWGICDTVCFHLFDRTPHAFRKVAAWARSKKEFERRAAFALLASLAGHDRTTPDGAFERCLPLVESTPGTSATSSRRESAGRCAGSGAAVRAFTRSRWRSHGVSRTRPSRPPAGSGATPCGIWASRRSCGD
jgi:hypothetical protein